MSEHCLIQRLAANRRDNHINLSAAVNAQPGCRAGIGNAACIHLASKGKTAVTQRHHLKAGMQRGARQAGASAKGGLEMAADASGMRLIGCCRIVQHTDQYPCGAGIDKGGQNIGVVGWRTGAGIVLNIGQDHRLRLCHSMRHGCVGVPQPAFKRAFCGTDTIIQPVECLLQRHLVLPIGNETGAGVINV